MYCILTSSIISLIPPGNRNTYNNKSVIKVYMARKLFFDPTRRHNLSFLIDIYLA